MHYEWATRGQNFYELDTNLQRLLRRIAPQAMRRFEADLDSFGAFVGGPVDEQAEYTDRHGKPVLETYARDGQIQNRIRHNPAWDAVSREAYVRGAIGLNYTDNPAPFTLTFAMGYLLSEADVALHCPVTMTGAVAYVLDRFAPTEIRAKYLSQLTRMDGAALSGGTWATELHGGSDIGATTTTSRREGDHVRLNGLKWFTSNANGGLAVATARPEGAPTGSKGLGLYLVPTHLDDGAPNPMRIRRLKDKLGTTGVPTGEIDLTDTWAMEVAPPPLGFKLMMEALGFSRIHNAVGSAGVQRRAFLEAASYLSHRSAFGANVLGYPMVQDEIVKMVVRLESGCALAFEAARAFDEAHKSGLDDEDAGGRPWLRLATALAKYQTAEDAFTLSRMAIELVGGNAYTSDYQMARMLRDAQVLTVWEGPANIQALEVLRMIGNRAPGFEAFEQRAMGILHAAPEPLGSLCAPLREALGACREAVAYLRNTPQESPKHARKLMVLLAETLGGLLLLEEAAIDWAEGDMRKALVCRLYLQEKFTGRGSRGIGPGHDWHHKYFAALMGYDPIAVEASALRAV